MSAAADLHHAGRPGLGRASTFEGDVLLNRCADCGAIIWRTPERFVWRHSVPSRTARTTAA